MTTWVDVKLAMRPNMTNAWQNVVLIATKILTWRRRDANVLCSIIYNVIDLVMESIQCYHSNGGMVDLENSTQDHESDVDLES